MIAPITIATIFNLWSLLFQKDGVPLHRVEMLIDKSCFILYLNIRILQEFLLFCLPSLVLFWSIRWVWFWISNRPYRFQCCLLNEPILTGALRFQSERSLFVDIFIVQWVEDILVNRPITSQSAILLLFKHLLNQQLLIIQQLF